MNKRIILKTTLICIGIFLILSSAGIYFFSTKYELDTERKYQVIVAEADIPVGSIIIENMITYKTVKESGLTPHMLQNSEQVVGMKVLSPILQGDYIPQYNLLPPDKWHKDDDRTIILTVDMEDRLANLIKKGSVIDIKVLPEDRKTLPKLVLSRIMVSDVLDENGLSSGDAIGNRKGYIVVVLNNEQRNRIYAAMQYGKLMYELYCDSTQPREIEDFVIPKEFYAPEQQSGSIKDGGAN
jgi:Flp pilus assembly protein CpaB